MNMGYAFDTVVLALLPCAVSITSLLYLNHCPCLLILTVCHLMIRHEGILVNTFKMFKSLKRLVLLGIVL